ncbi:hypothetical protein G6N74_11320 [Mesorhizobium sp. CGMCC 1.15528]|uniref:Uncharacterized protein n=1 Tax=Mesorhizobium zhangyense TaxID=1776730 RepID=A0A7C9R6Z1_9HYPH|nr:hypothetical protein [Mesorhizobium zhangyense]NGN41661.1 hypothetical protein [Mesorhizobium zhangyense]
MGRSIGHISPTLGICDGIIYFFGKVFLFDLKNYLSMNFKMLTFSKRIAFSVRIKNYGLYVSDLLCLKQQPRSRSHQLSFLQQDPETSFDPDLNVLQADSGQNLTARSSLKL